MSSFAAACASCVLLLAAAVAPTPPASRPFHVIDAVPGSWTVIDPQQITLEGGGIVRRALLVRVVRNIMSTPPGQPGYIRTLTDYDCERREFRWREFAAFARTGEPLVSRKNPGYAWEGVDKSPDTLAAYQVVCGQGSGRGVVAAESVAKLVITLMASWDPKPEPEPTTPAPPKAATPKTATKKPPAANAPKKLSLNDLWP